MSVLIKGMEMPTSCNDCPLAGDFKCNLMPSIPALCKEYDMAVQNGKRLNNCPLVEIPPHGRLIDADAPIPLVDTHGKNIEVTVAHIIENNLGIVNAIIESEASR